MSAVLAISKHGRALSDISKTSRLPLRLFDERHSFFSQLLFLWVSPLLKKGLDKTLVYDDLILLKQKYRSINLLRCWRLGSKANIVWVLLVHYRWSVFTAFITKLISIMFSYLNPFFLKLLIEATTTTPLSRCLTIAVMMFMCAEFKSLFSGIHTYVVTRDSVLALSILTNTILKKSLRLSNGGRSTWPGARIINLATVDTEALVDAALYVHFAWSSLFEIVLALIFLYFTIGSPFLAAVIIVIIYAPLNFLCSRIIRSLQARQMRVKDKRVKLTKEILNGMKVVKLYAWEEPFEAEINRLRNEEVKLLTRSTLVSQVLEAINSVAPLLATIICFTWFVLISPANSLTPQVAFVTLAVLNQLRMPMSVIARTIHFLTKGLLCSRRLNEFFDAEELHIYKEKVPQGEHFTVSVEVQNAFFSWSKEKEDLKDITFNLKKNELNAIVGPTGSGKSSMLAAFLGEMTLLDGHRKVSGTIGYVPQTPWILNDTIRANILFGNDFDKNKYDRVIRACDLKKDLYSLPRCDATMVGENGVFLSTGQCTRIALARALYQDCDIYLLDDPFSTVDSTIAKTMYDMILGPKGILSKKAVVLTTHRIALTQNANTIHIMQDGRIVDCGAYVELLLRSKIFSRLRNEMEPKIEEGINMSSELMKPRKKAKAVMFEQPQPDESKNLEKVEERAISSNVYLKYLKAFSYQWFFIFLALLVSRYSVQALSGIWLSGWSDQNLILKELGEEINTERYLYIYIVTGVGTVFLSAVALVSSTFGGVRASVALHSPLIKSLMRAPITFFEQKPVGTLLSRLTEDLDVIDLQLPVNLRLVIDALINIGMVVTLISVTMPVFIFFIVPFTAGYIIILKFFIPSYRQIQRIANAQRSHLLSTLSQNIDGVVSIRAFKRTKLTLLAFHDDVDALIRCRYLAIAIDRWLALRLQLLGNLMVLLCVVLVSFIRNMDLITSGQVGLCVSYALSITDIIHFSIQMIGQSEADIVSVERIREYHNIKEEGPWISEYPLIDAWPHTGRIDICKYALNYGKDKINALRNISLSINGGEKIAVVGRKGSGKSSLAIGLLRLIEPTNGTIRIDGVDITELGLHELRARITIIPQDPILFSSTLRFNLDPFNQFADSDIWISLEACQLKEIVSKQKEGLLWSIEESGKEISLCNRQLLCLCRALLKGGQIIVLDEATAAVDRITEELVYQVVRDNFKQSTTITIAHRLETIKDCDRVVVLDNGEMVEFDTPGNLLNKPDSLYRKMVMQSKS